MKVIICKYIFRLGDINAFGADPRRVATAGHDVDNAEPIDISEKYSNQNSSLSARYDSLKVKTKPKENNDYVNGKSFCCGDNSLDEIEQNETNTAENAKLEDNLYFYHPDHLGSTNLITNFDGEVTQSVAYVPYGEVFVEERNGSWSTPYLFNAKELDEETGLYYYGARYLDPMDVRWLSVDQKVWDYPGMSPYNYCAGNPIKLIDPDGEDWISAQGNKVIWYAGEYGDKTTILHTYRASSGFEDPNFADYRNSKYQYVQDFGPTVEGKYELRLGNGDVTKAKVEKGIIKRAGEGIESMENLLGMDNDVVTHDWGENRVKLFPIEVEQPVDPKTKRQSKRDLDSFYFHDSKKGHTSGCHEIESDFFEDLQNYAKEGNKKIEVEVKYEKNQSTYGHTDQ